MKATLIAAMLLVAGSLTGQAIEKSAPIFAHGALSTGWMDFELQDGKRIFLSATVNGHATKVLLATGLPVSDIDKTFAASIGLAYQAKDEKDGKDTDDSTVVYGIKIQIGNMTLRDTSANGVDFAPLAKHIGHPLPLLLGDDVFDHSSVDIDFAHHRICFQQEWHSVEGGRSD